MKVFVATYNHEYGLDLRVFSNKEKAYKWMDDIASYYWGDAYPDKPKPAEDIGIKYFENMKDFSGYIEDFEIIEAEVEAEWV